MEKYIVFGPIIIFFGIFALLVFGFLGLVAKLFFKAKADAWIGEVIDKSCITREEDDKKHQYLSLKVKLENGEVHSIPATYEFYNQIKIGDKLQKEKGKLWPKKIS